jgi:hypothetical protein
MRRVGREVRLIYESVLDGVEVWRIGREGYIGMGEGGLGWVGESFLVFSASSPTSSSRGRSLKSSSILKKKGYSYPEANQGTLSSIFPSID